MAPYKRLWVEPLGNATVIRLAVPRIIDDPVTDELWHEVAAAIVAAMPPNIIIDLAGVQLVSSAGNTFFTTSTGPPPPARRRPYSPRRRPTFAS